MLAAAVKYYLLPTCAFRSGSSHCALILSTWHPERKYSKKIFQNCWWKPFTCECRIENGTSGSLHWLTHTASVVCRLGGVVFIRQDKNLQTRLTAQREENPPANAGDPGSIPGPGRSPGEGNGNPLQYSCLGKSHGHRSLVGYSPWGCKSQTRLSN